MRQNPPDDGADKVYKAANVLLGAVPTWLGVLALLAIIGFCSG